MAKQAYELKNFKQILSWYAMLVKNRMLADEDGLGSNSPFSPQNWTVTETVGIEPDTRTITRIIDNPGASYGQSILDAFQSTADSIHHSLATLFINHDDDKTMWQEDLNFNLINAYAAASQSLQRYDKDTEEFEEMPEFWFTRGCWYDMLPMCTKGKYLLEWRSNVETKVRNAISLYRGEGNRSVVGYKRNVFVHTYTSTDSDGTSTTETTYEYYSPSGNSMDFILDFWRKNLAGLKAAIDPYLEPIFHIGHKTDYPEQNSKTANIEYVTQLASDIAFSNTSASAAAGASITTAKSLSAECGKYDAKAAKMTLSC